MDYGLKTLELSWLGLFSLALSHQTTGGHTEVNNPLFLSHASLICPVGSQGPSVWLKDLIVKGLVLVCLNGDALLLDPSMLQMSSKNIQVITFLSL